MAIWITTYPHTFHDQGYGALYKVQHRLWEQIGTITLFSALNNHFT